MTTEDLVSYTRNLCWCLLLAVLVLGAFFGCLGGTLGKVEPKKAQDAIESVKLMKD